MKTTLPVIATIAFLAWATPAQAADENTHSGFGDSYFANQPHPGFGDPASTDTPDMDAASVRDIEPAAGGNDEQSDVMIRDFIVIEREDSPEKLDEPANDNDVQ